ncbi:sn-glycerol 3-phosphate transport system substrate-binding protein [Devosia crocina]|uniref:sn-glycerol 3-phosphate transport system substrate-binding protein n=1 Tax=Devosia crocina TaxID=429728 RepID=A0A1I7NV33_9HYPH|nr:ABC transporter substrate-binding protein [Devosia crocina]SFV38448.1 sn-glycerol 3-phosphate transport system substrate-binding protein [Devosia crocina]
MSRKLHTSIAASLLVLAVSATAAQAQTTVTFWHSFNNANGRALDEIVANFEAVHPEINIEAEYVGNYNDIVARLQAAIPANRGPDAVILEVTRYGLFADAGVLADLTPYFDADPLKDELYDYARQIGVIGEKNFIVPFNSSTPVLYYNKDVLARAGIEGEPDLKTFDAITTAARSVNETLGAEGITGIAAPGQFARWGLVMANGSDLIDPMSGEILLDDPKTLEAYEWMASLVTEGLASADGVTEEDNGRDAFLAGKVGIMMNSTGNYVGSRSALGDKLGVLPMPCNPDCAVPIGGAGIGIMATSQQDVQDAAYEFVSYAASPEANAIWFAATGYLPINKNSAELPVAADALASQPGIDVAINSLPHAHGRARTPVVTWMRTTEYDMWQAMALGQRPVAETMTQFAADTRAEAARLGN